MLDAPIADDGHGEYGGAIEKHCPSERDALIWLANHLTGRHSQFDRIEPEVRLIWLINSHTGTSIDLSGEEHPSSISDDKSPDQQIQVEKNPIEINGFRFDLISTQIEATCRDFKRPVNNQNSRPETRGQFCTPQLALDWIARRLHGGYDNDAKIVQIYGVRSFRI